MFVGGRDGEEGDCKAQIEERRESGRRDPVNPARFTLTQKGGRLSRPPLCLPWLDYFLVDFFAAFFAGFLAAFFAAFLVAILPILPSD